MVKLFEVIIMIYKMTKNSKKISEVNLGKTFIIAFHVKGIFGISISKNVFEVDKILGLLNFQPTLKKL